MPKNILRAGRHLLNIALLLAALVWGESFADVAAGVAAYKRGDFANAFAELSSASAKDDAFAQNLLGTMYFQGRGVERNEKLAADCFFKAQALGSPEAMANLAAMYEAGQGLPQDSAAALKYFGEAASAGNRPAIARMARIYEKGELGVAPDPALAASWRARLGAAQAARVATPKTMAKPQAEAGKNVASAPPSPQKSAKKEPALAVGTSLDERIAQLEKRVTRNLEIYSHRERKLFVASSDATEPVVGYLKALRARLANLPAAAAAAARPAERRLVTLAIGRDGVLREVELSRSSGNESADGRVLAAVKKLVQWQPLSPEIAHDTDVLYVTVRLPIV